ncbi:MAG: hypothetical protein MI723_13770 [Caulobacterales bacterium]|nr:hypothetical protein [Caulobacterales bacterium]
MTSRIDPAALARRIRDLQDRDGRIRWIEAGLYDPWNHMESAMGLAVAGEWDAARAALAHLRETQRPDGAWEGEMGCAAPLDADNRRIIADAPRVLDTNFCAYPALAVWHLAAVTGEPADLHANADMIERSAAWVLGHQRPDGAFAWRAREPGEDIADIGALRAGSASIYKSLEGAIRLLAALDRPTGALRIARARLGRALRLSAEGAWLDKRDFAMDWYYPVLSGALERAPGRARLAAGWRRFVHPRWGCRCVAGEPWATAAETCELAIAAACVGADGAARRLLATLDGCVTPQGDLWMGRQFAIDAPWPEERPSWTAGAALLAADVVERRTPGAQVFLRTLPESLAPATLTRSVSA